MANLYQKAKRNLITVGAVSLTTIGLAGCPDKDANNGMPKIGEPLSVNGTVVNIDSSSYSPSKIARSAIVSGPEGKFYYISTTDRKRWNDLRIGNDVQLTGEYAGYDMWKSYKRMPVADVRWANLRKLEERQ